MENIQQEQLQQLKQLQIQIQQLELQLQLQQQEEQGTKNSRNKQKTKQNQDEEQSVEKEAARYYELPKVLTTIDLGQIQSMLSANLLAVKQYRQAVQDCQLPDIKRQFIEASQMHFKHYNELLNLLSDNGGSSS